MQIPAPTPQTGSSGIPFIPQRASNDCGPASLAMALGYHGRFTELAEVMSSTKTRKSGTDVWSLLEAARHFGLDGEGVRLEDVAALELLPAGSILHCYSEHYVVIESYLPDGGALIVDPAYGPRKVNSRALARSFSGIAIVLAPGPEFSPRPGRAQPIPRKRWLVLRATYWTRWLVSALGSALGLKRSRRPHRPSPSPAAPPAPEP